MVMMMETEEERQQEPFCSVLNVVIDFTMEPPCPLEPEEFLQIHPQPSMPPQKVSTNDSFLVSDSANQDRFTKTTTPTGVVGAVKGNSQLLVPVVRVFGPVLRRGGSGVEGKFGHPPQQSCCLYIHGAYPYLLARPRQAGPDGSLSHGKVPKGHVNWDSVESIERVASHIGATLEAAIQAFTPFETNYNNNNNNNNNNTGNTHKKPSPAPGVVKVIRGVTVVQGRGFYTYCPGPPAPFLRIEYYDPKLRWKVKTVLERGLELPDLYHPHPEQYHYFQYNNINNNDINQNADSNDGVPLPPPPAPEEMLRFHCYEAHIPYTMQFFKDWNLSGMSYIHLSSGKFRGPLPFQARRLDVKLDDTDNNEKDDGAFFLQSNTSSDFLWPAVPIINTEFSNHASSSPIEDLPPSSQSTIVSATHDGTADDGNHNLLVDTTSITTAVSAAFSAAASAGIPPPKKETSCHVEFDCTVQDILNVQTVIHSMPTEQEERDKIQWRAVPSLQEIWRQERRRMSKLLPPEDDFLSFPNLNSQMTTPATSQETTEGAKDKYGTRNKMEKTPPFTLDVKKGASRPGGRLACKGMWGLVNVSMGLQVDFVRALSQIVRRHKQTVWEMDNALMMQKQEQPTPTLRTSRLLFQNSDDFDDEMSTASGMVQTQSSKEPLTPTMDEAIEALGALAGQHEYQIQSLTPTMDEAIEALGGLAGQFDSDAVSSTCLNSTPLQDESSSNIQHAEELILSSSVHDDDIDSPTQSCSQGMQWIQGQTYDSSQDSDSVKSGNGQVDLLNPSCTLIYQSSQDLHESSRTSTMQMTQEEATSMDPMEYSQRGQSSLCSGAFGNDDDDLEDYIDPETLLPYEELYFGEARCLVKFIVQTDAPGTMRLCGASALGCTRKGHQVSHDRARPGYYRTITTGNVVDGRILPTGSLERPGVFSADSPATQCDEDDEEEDDDQFEHVLSMLATQIPSTQSEKPTQQQFTPYSQDDAEEEMEEIGYDAANKRATPLSQRLTVAGGESSNEETAHLDDIDGQSSKDSDDYESICSDDHKISDFISPNSIEPEETIPANTAHTSNDSAPKRLDDASYEVDEDVAMPIAHPPTAYDIGEPTGRIGLCSLERTTSVPSWLTHSTKYAALRDERKKSHALPSSNPFQLVGRDGKNYVQPVALPPTSRQVAGWYKQKFRCSAEQPNRKETSRIGKKREREPEDDGLEIDGNSRKLVPRAGGKMGRTGDAQSVEEVQWELSQLTQHLAESQQTPPDDCGDAPTDVPQALSNEPHEFESPNVLVMSIDSGEAPPYESKTMESSSISESQSASQNSDQPLDGIGNQGGRIHVQGGGGLKARTRPSQATTPTKDAQTEDGVPNDRYADFLPSPISFMSIEIHVQCRTGASRLDGQKIAMTPSSSKDEVFAIVYIYGRDPSGGELLQILERGCLFVPLETESASRSVQIAHIRSSIPRATMGVSAKLSVECLKDEKSLLLRLASIVRMKDPDMLMSWNTQCSGLGYLIERGLAMGKDGRHHDDTTSVGESGRSSLGLDMARLLGRTPHRKKVDSFAMGAPIEKKSTAEEAKVAGQDTIPGEDGKWKGSGLGKDWDESVGAGAAAASITGRLIFAAWKIVTEEVKHGNASYLPAIVSAVLNKRIPHHDDLTLSRWYSQSKGKERWRVLHHRLIQATAPILIFDALDIIGRAGEAARLSGVEFSQSFPGIRGSQYKVEGVLLRALQSLRSDERGSKKGSKKKSGSTSLSGGTSSMSDESKSQTQSPWKIRRANAYHDEHCSEPLEGRQYFFYSPAKSDADRQEALEVQALTLEPISGHYRDPVVVCDFTALYPSLMIAYNLCYSTCAGKLEYHSTRREMRVEGRTTRKLGPMDYSEGRTATVLTHHMKSLEAGGDDPDTSKDRAYVAPTGTIYVSEDVVKGVLPQVLDEMLTTRAMLKKAAKQYKKKVPNLSPAILRQLEARQLALKYVANVTYGYTSATFSGRCAMPLLADAIVACARQTLRKAIDLVNRWGRENPKWIGCQVIYGDTDSVFVKLPGRTYKEAFDFGEELCRVVTADNPPPVQLKLEKVYLGSIMQTMKRYCGMKFEARDQKKPVFEAKGLETIRRDQCALTQKVLRNALVTLFRSGPEEVKAYLFRQWSLIFSGNLPVQDFILTGKVRSKYRGGKEGPVQATLARRLAEADPGRIVRRERQAYVIVATPGVNFKLKDCVLTPLELLERWDAYTIHSAYYITRHVNASLQRCLGLAPHFIDVNAWYQSCPKPRRRIHFWPVYSKSRAMITSYFGSDICSLCQNKCKAQGRSLAVVCGDCQRDRAKATQTATLQLNRVQRAAHAVSKECSRCNHCFEDAATFATVEKNDSSSKRSKGQAINVLFGKGSAVTAATSLVMPIANCVCIDCPITFERHRLREREIESIAICKALDLF